MAVKSMHIATFYVTHAFDPTWMFCETMGLFKERKNAMVINAILNILLSVVLAKPFGMAGILGATAIARVLTIVWWEPYILFKKKFKRPGPLYIAVTPVAFGYYLAGNLIHKAGRILKDKQIGEKITGKGNIVLLLVSCALITVLSLYNKPVLMYENSYGNVLISLVTAFIGYYVLSDMAKLMHENAFLQWCGKNSIIVYVVHFSIVQGT